MKDEYSGSERRKSKRFKVHLTVFYRQSQPLDVRIRTVDKEYQATMLDMSEGGVCILSDINIPVPTTLDIRFTLTQAEKDGTSYYGTVEVKGKVCYTISVGQDLYRLGISFLNIDDISRLEIRHFLQVVESNQGRAPI